jgi:hypothetical protein
MPYIRASTREKIALGMEPPITPGDLNYAITTLCLKYLQLYGNNYAMLNEVVGVLECAKLELYRRVIAPYEDQKKLENGEVYYNAK